MWLSIRENFFITSCTNIFSFWSFLPLFPSFFSYFSLFLLLFFSYFSLFFPLSSPFLLLFFPIFPYFFSPFLLPFLSLATIYRIANKNFFIAHNFYYRLQIIGSSYKIRIDFSIIYCIYFISCIWVLGIYNLWYVDKH